MKQIGPENLIVEVVRAYKRIEEDSFENGCDPDSARDKPICCSSMYPSVLDAYREITEDPDIKADQISTIDPNIYQDKKSGQTVVHTNNTARGQFRCNYDRQETVRGKVPNAETVERWKKNEVELYHVTYELEFNLKVVGLEEKELAEFLGINNW